MGDVTAATEYTTMVVKDVDKSDGATVKLKYATVVDAMFVVLIVKYEPSGATVYCHAPDAAGGYTLKYMGVSKPLEAIFPWANTLNEEVAPATLAARPKNNATDCSGISFEVTKAALVAPTDPAHGNKDVEGEELNAQFVVFPAIADDVPFVHVSVSTVVLVAYKSPILNVYEVFAT